MCVNFKRAIRHSYFIRRSFREPLFPCRCPFCGRVIFHDMFCCDYHGGKFAEYHGVKNTAADVTVIPFLYDDVFAKHIFRYKDDGCSAYAAYFAAYIAARLAPVPSGTLVIAIPPNRAVKGEQYRDYNPPALIARELAHMLGIGYTEGIIGVKGGLPRQKDLNAAERRDNAYSKYYIRKRKDKVVRDTAIIVVDDVSTTGSTLSAVTELLRNADAARITAVAAGGT